MNLKLQNRPLAIAAGFFAIYTVALPAQTMRSGYRGGLISPPLPKPSFTLADTYGARFDFRARTEGYITLLFFGYTSCPDQCPMHMATVGAALKKLPPAVADRIQLIFVTTDPTRDTPAVLRRWLDQFNRGFVGLTGTEAAIEAVQRATGIPPARKTGPIQGSYAVAHANFVLAYTRDNLAHVIYPGGVTADDWIHDMSQLVNERWNRH